MKDMLLGLKSEAEGLIVGFAVMHSIPNNVIKKVSEYIQDIINKAYSKGKLHGVMEYKIKVLDLEIGEEFYLNGLGPYTLSLDGVHYYNGKISKGVTLDDLISKKYVITKEGT